MRQLFLLLSLFFTFMVHAQRFEDYFADKTLRLDYIFAGNQATQHVYLHELVSLDKWHGRKSNLGTAPIQGYGQIKVYDKSTQELIYVLPFGSLFQEWLTLDEAKTTTKSFENTFLIPFPKNEIDIQVLFFNTKNEGQILLQHTVNPNDILIKKTNPQHHIPYEVIHSSTSENPIKIAIIAEGFSQSEMDDFMDFAKKTKESLFGHEIFDKHKNSFEIIAVQSVSEKSGVSVPSEGKWSNSVANTHFDTFYSPRYLTTSHVFQLHDLLANIPYQHIIILANTDVYGGGGILNSYAISTTKNSQFAAVVVHEFGHSFAGLADEYFYQEDVFENKATQQIEPWEKNITSLTDFDKKWKSLLSPNTPIPTPDSLANDTAIGVFEGLQGNGLYIPSHHCRMKTNQAIDFCLVCRQAIKEMMFFYTLN